jgi:TetR/AcrR family transcriptional regulator, regulator of autoinduction and epiphytic fitness
MMIAMAAVNARARRSRGPAPSRRDRALATRRRIIEAALVRFRNDGYAATTMEMIARDAGVAVQTVYFTFHTKAALLLAALTVSGGEPGGPEDPVDRAWFGQVMAAETGTRRLALIVELGNGIYERISPLMPAVRAASTVDPAVDVAMAELVARRRDGMRRVIDEFVARNELRSGLEPTLALDLLIGIHRWETYQAFTVECAWSLARYKAWQFATLAQALLPPAVADAALAPGATDLADCSFARDLPLFR